MKLFQSLNDIDLLKGMKASYDAMPPDVSTDTIIVPDTPESTEYVANSNPNNNNFELLSRTWPNLTEAEIIAAVNKSQSINIRPRGNYFPRGRPRGCPRYPHYP